MGLAGAAAGRLAEVPPRKGWMRVFGRGGGGAQVTPTVALGCVGGRPELEVVGLGSNRRLAREDWVRPLDFEAARLKVQLPEYLRSH